MDAANTAEILASVSVEILLAEVQRRAVEAGMTAEDFVRETRNSIRQGREENTAGREVGHETEE